MRIDSHQHFWSYDPENYAWINGSMGKLRRDFLPDDIKPELVRHQIDGTVAVQARQSEHENRFLLELGKRSDLIRGVVGWVDLKSPTLDEKLHELKKNPKFVGVRHVLQDEPDDNFALSREFRHGIQKLKAFNLAYDFLVFPRQIPACITLVEQFPEQKFVLDHMGKPSIRDGIFQPWSEHIKILAKAGTVFCKISGMVTEAKWNAWKKDDFTRYLDLVFEEFTPDRLMFGSDWPVCLVAAGYEGVCEIVESYISQFPAADRARIMGKNAVQFYGLDPN